MAASRICQGVTKSGSPTPREITSFIPCTMSKKSRMPERGMRRTCDATNSSGWEASDMDVGGDYKAMESSKHSLPLFSVVRVPRVITTTCRLEIGDTAGWKPALLPKALLDPRPSPGHKIPPPGFGAGLSCDFMRNVQFRMWLGG